MSRVLAGWESKNPSRGGRPEKYPWDLWFDGRIYELRLGEDFRSQPTTMAAAARAAARRRGHYLRVSVRRDTVVLQAEGEVDEGRDLD